MSYTLGQQVVLTTAVTDLTGTPTDATMTLTVTKPDGTTLVSGVGLTISHAGTGAYTCNVATDQPGTWLYLWTASGAAIGIDDGQFDVLAITRRIASLADAKIHMNKNGTGDDVEIQDFLDASQAVIQREIGPVVPTAFTETIPLRGGCTIALTQAPVISVTSLGLYQGSTTPVPLTSTDYRLYGDSGIVERINGGWPIEFVGTDALVTYLAGRTGAVPANIRLGHLELTAHLWRNSQQGRNRRVRGAGPEDDVAGVALGFSIPNRVRELIGPKRPAMF
jgi:hypothetical protein